MDTSAVEAFIDNDGAAPEPEPVAEESAPVEPVEQNAAEAVSSSESAEESADSFPREYVEKLRKESASYRERAKKFETTFEGLDENDRETFLWLVDQYKGDAKAAGKEMLRLAQTLVGDEAEGESAPAEPQYMTKADYERIRAEEATNARVAKIEADAQALGYKMESTEYMTLLLTANREAGGDIHKAHEMIKAREESIAKSAIEKFLADKQASAEGSPAVPPSGGGVPSGERKAANLKETGQAALAWLQAQG